MLRVVSDLTVAGMRAAVDDATAPVVPTASIEVDDVDAAYAAALATGAAGPTAPVGPFAGEDAADLLDRAPGAQVLLFVSRPVGVLYPDQRIGGSRVQRVEVSQAQWSELDQSPAQARLRVEGHGRCARRVSLRASLSAGRRLTCHLA